MSKAKHTAADDARYDALSARMEAGEYSTLEDVVAASAESGMSFDELLDEIDALESIDSDKPTPAGAPASERATEQDVRELIAAGRPSLNGSTGAGPSPKRQVRLPTALDDALTERAEREHRKASEIIRDALDAYLRAS